MANSLVTRAKVRIKHARRRTPQEFRKHWRATPEETEAYRIQAATPLEQIFYAGTQHPILKWEHTLALYDEYFSRYRNTDVGILEIGVLLGGSLDLWRTYFGPRARVTGVDIDPTCAARVTPPNKVAIGSQEDADFMRRTVSELGRLDLVLDDGSHIGEHQIASFKTLFPLLEPGGLYVIEDLHTSYWPDFKGGLGRRGTGIDFVKTLIDDMHGWYYRAEGSTPAKDWIPAIHVYDSIVFIEKHHRRMPQSVGTV